jgi:A/G-specific adenine glycosylase
MARQTSDFGLTEAQVADFRAVVWDHYRREGRDLPWRRTRDPYAILVSEVMLRSRTRRSFPWWPRLWNATTRATGSTR